MFKLSDVVVLDSAGTPDVEASVTKFRFAMESLAAHTLADLDSVGEAVNRVYDKHPGVSLTANAIRSFTLQELPPVSPSAIGLVEKRIAAYMKSHTADKDRADGKCPDGSDPIFVMTRGPGGGSRRLSDIKESTST